ncbi:MAG: AAA family ATPase, partial [Candidatus Eremiobacteraeota bacterium]|nr:AAA family ATPase [Candidatus Eremiobacteraeota bacterium]
MIIKRLKFEDFGCLSGEFLFGKGLTIVIGRNETGKTTLADGILAMLFGPEKPGEYENYKPWGEDRSFGGEMEIGLEDGSDFLISRKFFPRSTCRILQLPRREDVTSKFLFKTSRPHRYSLLEANFGITKENFKSSAFVTQGEVVSPALESLSARIEGLLSSGDEYGSTPSEVLSRLGNAIKSYQGITSDNPIRVETEMKRLEDKIKELENEISGLESRADILRPNSERLKDIEKEMADLAKKKWALAQLSHAVTAREILKKLEKDKNLRSRLAGLEEKIEKNKKYEKFPADKHASLIKTEENIRNSEKKVKNESARRQELERKLEKNLKEQECYEDLKAFTPLQKKFLEEGLIRLGEWKKQVNEKQQFMKKIGDALA